MQFNQGNRHSVTLIDIRLDSDVVVLRGTPTEAAGSVLRGTVAIILNEPLSVRGINLKLIGVERVGLHESVSKSRSVKHEKVIYEKDWQFLDFEHDPKKCFVLGAGNYEYPFEHIFPGNTPESVEGLENAYIVYRLRATIERPRFSQDIHAKKHLRVVRTLSPEDEALSSTMAVENVWPEKCEYSISIPAKACVFGTSIPLSIGIVSLLKGLTIGKVTCTLREFDTYSILERGTKKQDTRNIQTTTYEHGSYENSDDGSERWVMNTLIDLPKSLSKCVQDCEVGAIKVRHKLRVSVQLHNPDGHTSELRASLPVQLFISPNHLIGEDNEIHPTESSDHLQDITAVPPRYDEHIYDRLWDDIPHDYSTPLPSGANTPGPLSRNNSAENLTAFGNPRTLASLSPPNLEFMATFGRSRSSERPGTSSSFSATSSDRASAEDLQATLAAADEGAYAAATSANTHGHNIAFDGRGRRLGTRSAGNTRPNSPEDSERSNTLQVPARYQFPVIPLLPLDINELSRVPSYQTAMRTRPHDLGDDISSLPRYEGEGLNAFILHPESSPQSRESSPPRSIVSRLGFTLRSGHLHSQSVEHPGRTHHGLTETGLRLLQARGR